jgi:hypothetical protein
MKLAAEFPVGTKLDIDALVETKSYQIQRFLHRYFLLARHYSPSNSMPRVIMREGESKPSFFFASFQLNFANEGKSEIYNKPFIQIGLYKPIQVSRKRKNILCIIWTISRNWILIDPFSKKNCGPFYTYTSFSCNYQLSPTEL